MLKSTETVASNFLHKYTLYKNSWKILPTFLINQLNKKKFWNRKFIQESAHYNFEIIHYIVMGAQMTIYWNQSKLKSTISCMKIIYFKSPKNVALLFKNRENKKKNFKPKIYVRICALQFQYHSPYRHGCRHDDILKSTETEACNFLPGNNLFKIS